MTYENGKTAVFKHVVDCGTVSKHLGTDAAPGSDNVVSAVAQVALQP